MAYGPNLKVHLVLAAQKGRMYRASHNPAASLQAFVNFRECIVSVVTAVRF